VAVLANLSLLAGPASASYDWTGTGGPCGSDFSLVPAADPVADLIAAEWYSCYTAREQAQIIVQNIGNAREEQSHFVETFPDGEFEPPVLEEHTAGDMAWEQLGVVSELGEDLLGVDVFMEDALGHLADIEADAGAVEKACGVWQPPGECEEPEEVLRLSRAQLLYRIVELLTEIRDQAAEPQPATVAIDPADLEPIVLASEEARDSFIETVWGSNGLWIGVAFLVVFWRVIRPGRT
jgi:hypothetical protein